MSVRSSHSTLNNGRGNVTRPIVTPTGATTRRSTVGSNGDSDQDVVIEKTTPALVSKASNWPKETMIVAISGIAVATVALIFACVVFLCVYRHKKMRKVTGGPALDIYTGASNDDGAVNTMSSDQRPQSHEGPVVDAHNLTEEIEQNSENMDLCYTGYISDSKPSVYSMPMCAFGTSETVSGGYDYAKIQDGTHDASSYQTPHTSSRTNTDDDHEVTFDGGREAGSGVDVSDNTYDVTDDAHRDATGEITYDVTYSGVDVRDNTYDVTDNVNRDVTRESTYDVTYSGVDIRDDTYDVVDNNNKIH